MAWAISCHLIYQILSMLNPMAGMNVTNHVWEPLDSVTKLEALTKYISSALKTEKKKQKKNPKMLVYINIIQKLKVFTENTQPRYNIRAQAINQ
jgi:hypothetical protein